ncbi:hypothetical protein YPPY89_4836, partial [Yersinia pestis PY-89]
MAPDNGWA